MRGGDMDYPYDLGPYSRKVTTTSVDAQRWFDRGLNWCFGYHHEEAVACFEKALESDPNCAMAHWGVAYAVGPNYNYPWELHDPAGKAAALAGAHDSARAALARVGRVTAPERALIEALPARYPQRDPIDDQRPWNDAFADATRLARGDDGGVSAAAENWRSDMLSPALSPEHALLLAGARADHDRNRRQEA